MELLFLSNELADPTWHRRLKVPLQFITFAFVEGKMYTHMRKSSTFIASESKRKWGSNVVYGALFLVQDHFFHIRSLDAYMSCSLSSLGKNHIYDLHHRVTTYATPITFSSVQDFCSLKYTEKKPVRCEMYVGNLTHPKIHQRLQGRHRIINGVDAEHFKNLIREVLT